MPTTADRWAGSVTNGVAKDAVHAMLDHLMDAFLISAVPLATESERQRNSNPRKLYPADQVERIRLANLLIREMGVNLEGAEVVLHMREQMIAMQRQFNEVLRLIGQEMKR